MLQCLAKWSHHFVPVVQLTRRDIVKWWPFPWLQQIDSFACITVQNETKIRFVLPLMSQYTTETLVDVYRYVCTDRDRLTCYTYGVLVYTRFKFWVRVWYALFWLNLLHIVYLFNTKEQFILLCKSWFVDMLNDMCLSQKM